ncbi:helix-turn-helix domain-containing protein [Streptomyces sp. GD-15H]|uniref:helix-turn-helix domain-containing protein n=1 Tax=Streptomyces sp. GD-15H TaxID=3129112 RepID=UPI003254A911
MFAAGVTPPQVARRLRVSRKSACAWHAAWRADGADALCSKGPSGCLSRMKLLAGVAGAGDGGGAGRAVVADTAPAPELCLPGHAGGAVGPAPQADRQEVGLRRPTPHRPPRSRSWFCLRPRRTRGGATGGSSPCGFAAGGAPRRACPAGAADRTVHGPGNPARGRHRPGPAPARAGAHSSPPGRGDPRGGPLPRRHDHRHHRPPHRAVGDPAGPHSDRRPRRTRRVAPLRSPRPRQQGHRLLRRRLRGRRQGRAAQRAPGAAQEPPASE